MSHDSPPPTPPAMESQTLEPQLFSPNKRPKFEPEPEPHTLNPNPPISPSSFKGKAPISGDDDDEDDDSPPDLPPQNCGICFSEQGEAFRGLIDCCDHYFCFLCIIEWSKIESRCPLCRCRFSSIRRVRKDGTFIGDGCVRVPARDQLYDPFGEPTDPYAHSRCTVCNGTSDESLLLLCDLCDSALHTYCVGLGYTVPEGDWFCQDCALLRAEQHDNEMNDCVDTSNDNVNSSTNPKHLDEESSRKASVSIFDIVRDSTGTPRRERGVDRLRKLVSPTKKFSCPTEASGQANIAHAGSSRDVTESSARTLRNCRDVRKHIDILRDNWDAFRFGSLGFSSGSVGPSRKGCGKTSLVGKQTGTSCNSLGRKNPYDVEKAWKLMTIAKSMKQVGKPKSSSKPASVKAHPRKPNNVASNCASFKAGMQSRSEKFSGTLPQRSGNHWYTGSFPEAATTSSSKPQNSSISRLLLSGKVQTPPEADNYHAQACLPSCGKAGRGLPTLFDDGFACSSSSRKPIAETFNVSFTKLNKKEIATSPHEQVRSADNCSDSEARGGPMKNICPTSCRPIAGTSDISSCKLCNKEISIYPEKQLRDAANFSTRETELQNSAQADICKDRAGSPSAKKLGGGSSKVFDECTGLVHSNSSHLPVASAFDTSQGKKVPACPSTAGAKILGKVSKNDEAKGEIQSLVKLNLKLLSKDKRLGADAFKDIARLSTHTILAACGFEHRKIFGSCPALVCHHTDQIQDHRRSTLMPSSCRECFYLFVNNVVNSIMSEKLTSSGVAS